MRISAVFTVGTILTTMPRESQTVILKENTYYVRDGAYYEKVLYGDEVAYQVVPKPCSRWKFTG